jgi:hypothetical protein
MQKRLLLRAVDVVGLPHAREGTKENNFVQSKLSSRV